MRRPDHLEARRATSGRPCLDSGSESRRRQLRAVRASGQSRHSSRGVSDPPRFGRGTGIGGSQGGSLTPRLLHRFGWLPDSGHPRGTKRRASRTSGNHRTFNNMKFCFIADSFRTLFVTRAQHASPWGPIAPATVGPPSHARHGPYAEPTRGERC